MRPSVSQLLSWQPARLAAAGTSLVHRAGDLQRQAADLTSIGSGLSAVWSGAAAHAATAHHRRRSAEVDELAAVVHTGGQALIRAAEAIRQARTGLQSALAAASAAGCTVLDDGSVLPPARPPVPGGLSDEDRTAWQADADATAAAQAAGAARLAQQIRAALTAAGAADTLSAAALTALQPPQVSPPPQPVTMGLTGGQWGPLALPSCPVIPASAPTAPAQDGHWWDGAVDQLSGFADGVRDGVVEPVEMVGGLVGLNGDVSDNWSDLGGGLWHGVTHPVDFGKALINWEDLAAGEYGHWAGELAPSVAAALLTGGAAAAVKGVSGTTALQRAGLTVTDVARLTDAQAAQVLMRGASPVPGRVVAGRAPVLGQDLSWHGTPESHIDRERTNFVGPIRRTDVRGEPLWYGNAHDAATPLGSGRSLFWGAAPRDLLEVGSTREYQRLWALPDAWGARNSLTVVRLPEGHVGPVWTGRVAPQPSFGPTWVGGAEQQLHHSLLSDHAVWTGPFPWERVRDPAAALTDAARAGAVGVAVRAPDLVAHDEP